MPTIRENFNAILTEALCTADTEERFRLTDKAWGANNPVGIDLEEVATNRKRLLGMYEDLAKSGHLGAMRACACIYFSGEADQTFTSKERAPEPGFDYKYLKPVTDITAINHPDYPKALEWCERAAEAGSEWAQKALPEMKKIIAASPAR